MLSLAATWITAAVFWLVYATVYWGNCSQSKMLLLVWLPTHSNLTPSHVLCYLHWLPVHQRIVFKTAKLIYKCLRGLDKLTPHSTGIIFWFVFYLIFTLFIDALLLNFLFKIKYYILISVREWIGCHYWWGLGGFGWWGHSSGRHEWRFLG